MFPKDYDNFMVRFLILTYFWEFNIYLQKLLNLWMQKKNFST